MAEHLTRGLDAVVLYAEVSRVYDRHLMLHIAGNPRDLGTVVQRASELGGVVD